MVQNGLRAKKTPSILEQLLRTDAKFFFKLPGEVAQIVEAHFEGDLRDIQLPLLEQDFGFVQADGADEDGGGTVGQRFDL